MTPKPKPKHRAQMVIFKYKKQRYGLTGEFVRVIPDDTAFDTHMQELADHGGRQFIKNHPILCATCYHECGGDVKWCAGCLVEPYCSKACQQIGWKLNGLNHRNACHFADRVHGRKSLRATRQCFIRWCYRNDTMCFERWGKERRGDICYTGCSQVDYNTAVFESIRENSLPVIHE
jgi:hypothetical protein